MIGSELTNPDPIQRKFANEQFLNVIEWLNQNNPFGCPTQPLFPTEDVGIDEKNRACEWNKKMPMDR